MGRRREILDRLESLERRLHHGGHGDDHHHHHCGHRDHCNDRGGDFDEKRVIDTIVRLVTEQVGKVIASSQDNQRDRGGRDEGGGEKRIVDLIVACVSEHVQEIVATELDKRLGRPEGKSAGDDRPGKPRGRGSSEPEA